ncbi:MAG: sterol desaturase family protein [Planctomycetota bacterium]|jgi:sterol desaturase/sphingolipid hydroxylase (fatty acid hydroxylase superfamily)
MTEVIIENEIAIRLGCFLGIFVIVAVWESLLPRRQRAVSRWMRWPSNLGIATLNQVLLRILIPLAAVSLALVAQERNWGLLNKLLVPGWFAVVFSLLILDFTIYLQHVMFHAVPALWRLHRMHHTDLDFDVTTGTRFHPIEIVLSMIIRIAVVAVLGPPVVAVLIFEVLLSGISLFNHGNVRLSLRLDQMLRCFVVTPDMHRVHHSIDPQETNSNFGFNLPWWDRLLSNYRAQPAAGHAGMTIGIEQFRTESDLRLDRMLIQPFCDPSDHNPINRESREV